MGFEDSSAGHTEVHTPTVNGATIDTAEYKYGGGSGKFVQASSQYVTYPDSNDSYTTLAFMARKITLLLKPKMNHPKGNWMGINF